MGEARCLTKMARSFCDDINNKEEKALDFIDQVRSLASRVAVAKDLLQTEEATKNAMVMPFNQLSW